MMQTTRRMVFAWITGILLSGSFASAGLIGYYPLDGNFNDASGNGNNAIAGTTSPTFGTGRTATATDQGAVFGGSDTQQTFTVPININSYDQVSFGAWIQASLSNPIRGIIGNDTGTFGREIGIDNRSGQTGFSAFDGTGVFGAGALGTGFDFVAVVYDRTAGTDTLYVNGQKFSTIGTPPNGDSFLTVGGDSHSGKPFGGTIDDVFVFNTALSDTEIADIRQNGIATTTAVPLPAASSMALLTLGSFAVLRLGLQLIKRA